MLLFRLQRGSLTMLEVRFSWFWNFGSRSTMLL
jgi:hypothetical protein